MVDPEGRLCGRDIARFPTSVVDARTFNKFWSIEVVRSLRTLQRLPVRIQLDYGDGDVMKLVDISLGINKVHLST